MKILIIEDEKLAAEKLNTLLTTVATDCEVISTQDSIDGAVAWLTEHPHPDLIISDIHLIDGLCFNIFRRSR